MKLDCNILYTIASLWGKTTLNTGGVGGTSWQTLKQKFPLLLESLVKYKYSSVYAQSQFLPRFPYWTFLKLECTKYL